MSAVRLDLIFHSDAKKMTETLFEATAEQRNVSIVIVDGRRYRSYPRIHAAIKGFEGLRFVYNGI